MTTTIGFKEGFDLQKFRPLANAPNASAAGVCLAYDLHNSADIFPRVFQLVSNTVFNAYNWKNDDWMPLASPALAGTFGAGAACIFHPHAGPSGVLAAGSTTTSVVISTALPAAVGVNQLANRGDGQGFKIRIIGNTAGGSGKVEERTIVGNTAGTAPTIYLDSALSFTPATGAAYELLSGRVFLLGAGTLAAGIFKYYDIATNSYSGNLATTNLPATIGTDSVFVSLSEAYVPSNRDHVSGFLGQLTATGSASTTLTGTVAGGDSAVLANEYRNFAIRIVEDTAIPTAVGQRRRIVSHTLGASPVYTVATWTVTPSTNAKFVIENDEDKLLLWSSGQTATYCYNITANTWDTSTWAARGNAVGLGCCAEHAFSIVPDARKLVRNSMIFTIRGGASSAIDVFDIAGAATGSWTANVDYGGKSQTFTTGTSMAHCSMHNGGRYLYINVNGTQRFLRFDMQSLTVEPLTYLKFAQGAAVVGNKLAMIHFVDSGYGTPGLDDPVVIPGLLVLRNTGAECFRLDIMR